MLYGIFHLWSVQYIPKQRKYIWPLTSSFSLLTLLPGNSLTFFFSSQASYIGGGGGSWNISCFRKSIRWRSVRPRRQDSMSYSWNWCWQLAHRTGYFCELNRGYVAWIRDICYCSCLSAVHWSFPHFKARPFPGLFHSNIRIILSSVFHSGQWHKWYMASIWTREHELASC